MPIPLAFTKLLRSFESCAEAVEKLVIFRKGGGMEFCSNGPGHMTMMASMPIYGKDLKKIIEVKG